MNNLPWFNQKKDKKVHILTRYVSETFWEEAEGECYCPTPCDSTMYGFTLSQAYYPAEHIMRELERQYNDFTRHEIRWEVIENLANQGLVGIRAKALLVSAVWNVHAHFPSSGSWNHTSATRLFSEKQTIGCEMEEQEGRRLRNVETQWGENENSDRRPAGLFNFLHPPTTFVTSRTGLHIYLSETLFSETLKTQTSWKIPNCTNIWLPTEPQLTTVGHC